MENKPVHKGLPSKMKIFFLLMAKCMQKAYDYGIYVSIKMSPASWRSLTYYLQAI